ncbi:MAG: DUF4911 domain-containing protein [Thermodesulfobacteriota bacterium]
MSRRKPQRRAIRRGPLPTRSARLYLRLAPRDIALCRFLLEARDNLGYLTVLDRSAAVLELVYSPGQEREVREAVAEIAEDVPLALLDPRRRELGSR